MSYGNFQVHCAESADAHSRLDSSSVRMEQPFIRQGKGEGAGSRKSLTQELRRAPWLVLRETCSTKRLDSSVRSCRTASAKLRPGTAWCGLRAPDPSQMSLTSPAVVVANAVAASMPQTWCCCRASDGTASHNSSPASKATSPKHCRTVSAGRNATAHLSRLCHLPGNVGAAGPDDQFGWE